MRCARAIFAVVVTSSSVTFVSARVAKGNIWPVICKTADELNAEPIVIGSRGLGRAGAALLGSVSAAVIAHTQRTVLVGHARP